MWVAFPSDTLPKAWGCGGREDRAAGRSVTSRHRDTRVTATWCDSAVPRCESGHRSRPASLRLSGALGRWQQQQAAGLVFFCCDKNKMNGIDEECVAMAVGWLLAVSINIQISSCRAPLRWVRCVRWGGGLVHQKPPLSFIRVRALKRSIFFRIIIAGQFQCSLITTL